MDEEEHLIDGEVHPDPKDADSLLCPNCGAPTEITSSGQCPYCGSVVTNGEHDWVLTDIHSIN